MAIGEHIVDLKRVAEAGLFHDLHADLSVFDRTSLNDYISLGKEVTTEIRKRVQQELCDEHSSLKEMSSAIVQQSECKLHLPVKVGDYTDFYSSIEHATNVGKMFRDPENALLPNWKHLPVGYHGRASSIVVSGTPVQRPNGQLKPDDDKPPVYGPSQRLDFELEVGFIVGKENQLGNSIHVQQAEDHIFGLLLFNDWSARDIQKWEYRPLGPFLGKNFASSVSPWIVPLEALDPFRVQGPEQNPEVLPYLRTQGKKNYDINLEVDLQPQGQPEPTTISRTNYRYMYWNMVQQLVHHTSGGCNVRIGDIMASGTISGTDPQSYGSLLELSWSGSTTLKLKGGQERTFLEDGDRVTIKGFARKDDIRVGFGEVTSKILPAKI